MSRCLRGIRGGNRASRFLLVRGPSGVGKTNLVVDGLIPWLRQAGGDEFHYEIVKVSGANSPTTIVQACCEALCREYLNFFQKNEASRRKLESVRTELVQLSGTAPREAGHRLAALVEEWGADEAPEMRVRFLLLVDGLSRLLEERAATGIGPGSVFDEVADPFGFFFELGAMNSLVVAVTYRDWIHKYVLRGLRQSGIGAAKYSGLLLEWPQPEMMADLVRHAIRVRGQKSGRDWDASLVEALVDDFSRSPKCLSYLLPILDAIEKEAAALEKPVCLLDYTGMGRLPGFITVYADSLFASADPSVSSSWAYLFSRFDEKSKQGQRLDHLSIPMPGIERIEEARLWRLVSFLTDRRLLSIEEGDKAREAMVEPLHPVLLTEWGRVGEWLYEYRPILAQVEQFEKQARSWQSSQRDARLLLNAESHLSSARQLLDCDQEVPLLTPHLAEYLRLSIEKKKKNARRYRRAVNTVSTVGIAAGVLLLGFLLEPVLGISYGLKKILGKSGLVENILLSTDSSSRSAPVFVPPSAPPPSAKPPVAKPKPKSKPPIVRKPVPKNLPEKVQLSSRDSRTGPPGANPPAAVAAVAAPPPASPAPAAAAPQVSVVAAPLPAGAGSVAGRVAPAPGAVGAVGEASNQAPVQEAAASAPEPGPLPPNGPAPVYVPGMSAAGAVAAGLKAQNSAVASAVPAAVTAAAPAGASSQAPVVVAAGADTPGAPAMPVAAVEMAAPAGEGSPAAVPESIRKLAEALAERARNERGAIPVSGAAAPPVVVGDLPGPDAAPVSAVAAVRGFAAGVEPVPAPSRSLENLEQLIAKFEQCQRDGDAQGAKAILKGFYEYFVPPAEKGAGEDPWPAPVERPRAEREEPFRVSPAEFRMLAYTLGDFFSLIGDTRGSDFARRHPAVLPSSGPGEQPANLDRDVRLLLARASIKAGNTGEAVRYFGREPSSEPMSSEVAAIRAAMSWAFGEKEAAVGDFRSLVEMTPEFSLPETIEALPWSGDARTLLAELREQALKAGPSRGQQPSS